MSEIFDWLTPVPFWGPQGTDGKELIRPALLEFATDKFMDEFLAEAGSGLQADWQKLKRREIPYKSAGDAPEDETDPVHPLLTNVQEPLKLFQPAHQRFYIVCASLCCRQPGFPDRVVRKADKESVFYVLRKLDTMTAKEYGWVVDGAVKSWKEVHGNPKSLLPNEDRLPMFTTGCPCDRTIQYGYVAVASKDTYKADVPIFKVPPTNAELQELALEERTQRIAQFHENITMPLTSLLNPAVSIATDRRQEVSLYLLSDLADYINTYFKSVADAILNDTTSSDGLLTLLDTHHLSSQSGAPTWRAALKQVMQAAQNLVFLIAHSDTGAYDMENQVASLLPMPSDDDVTATTVTPIPKLTANDGEVFQIRCVYERPCDSPFPARVVVSQPTRPFSMASFFDSDAPARPIRIEMPVDVGISAMRKFRKGVGFIASNAMRNKMSMATDGLLKSPPSPGSEGSFTLGMLCSFSIQIIFMVAFFLLLIFVIIFNILFWWLPFFRICLPIPKKAN